MAHGVFKIEHRVAYSECTLGDHIYHSRYLDLLERARGEFFRQLGVTFRELQETDTIFPVVECRVRYKTPARYDDVLTIELRPTAAERVRLDFRYQVLNHHNAIVIEAESLHVCAGLNGKPKRLPPELLAKLQPWLELECTATHDSA